MHRINYPTKVYVGAGLLGNLRDVPELQWDSFKGPALLVTDRGLLQTDLVARAREAFEAIGARVHVFAEVVTNPDDSVVEEGVAAFRAVDAGYVIGLGGGSALDVAKTVAVRLHHGGPLEQYDDLKGGDALIHGPIPQIVAVPTTAGTGSEVSRSSVIHIRAVDRKVVIFTPRMMPVLALLDAELTTGLPATVTAFTGLDALTHLIESYVATGYHPIADGVALEGVRMVFEHLPRVLAQPANLESRQEMLVASLMGAVAFQKGLGAAHSMAHPLSSVCGLHHGQANALVLRRIMEFNRDAIGEDRFRRLSFAAAPQDRPGYESFSRALTELMRVCSIPERLSAVGVLAEHVERMSDLAFADGCHQTNPKPVKRADFAKLFAELL